MASKNLTVRIDEELHAEASKVLEEMGLDLSTAVRMFLAQTVADGALPFQPATSHARSSVSYQVVALPAEEQ